MRRTQAPPVRPPLTRREREIVNAVFALGEGASADRIRARLHAPPGDSAVRVMLARLERKGWLTHRAQGVKFIYATTVSRAAARREAVRQLMHTFFGGSARALLTTLVNEEPWSDDELKSLRREIKQARKRRSDS